MTDSTMIPSLNISNTLNVETQNVIMLIVMAPIHNNRKGYKGSTEKNTLAYLSIAQVLEK
jgi:hypothetical protein